MVEVRGAVIGDGKPVIIAGPCSVESVEQLDKVASHLAAMGIKFLRGGAFKPRTSPYSFQGLGKRGLVILKEVAAKYDMRVVTEVVDPRHFEMVADMLMFCRSEPETSVTMSFSKK